MDNSYSIKEEDTQNINSVMRGNIKFKIYDSKMTYYKLTKSNREKGLNLKQYKLTVDISF